MQARAPAKAILSGEHAVVYGMPALALALPLYATVRLGPGSDPRCVELVLSDVNHQILLDPSCFSVFQFACEQRYQQFLDGDRAIETVLPNPSDLYHYALSLWCDAAVSATSSMATSLAGVRIELSSSIAIGSGMGSSAATVVALLAGIAGRAGQVLSTEQLVELSTRCERMQHGRSSGLDPAICSRGGLIQFQKGVAGVLPAKLDAHWYRVDSGRPQATTGSCTSWVKQRFGSSAVWSEFADVTRQLARALPAQDAELILDSLRHNHQLLCKIGVVPESVQQFVKSVERRGGAAKISGAGAVSGDQGGMILVYMPEGAVETTDSWNYSWQALEVDPYGAQFRN